MHKGLLVNLPPTLRTLRRLFANVVCYRWIVASNAIEDVIEGQFRILWTATLTTDDQFFRVPQSLSVDEDDVLSLASGIEEVWAWLHSASHPHELVPVEKFSIQVPCELDRHTTRYALKLAPLARVHSHLQDFRPRVNGSTGCEQSSVKG